MGTMQRRKILRLYGYLCQPVNHGLKAVTIEEKHNRISTFLSGVEG